MQVQTGPRVALLSQRPPRKLSIRSDAGVAKLADAQDLKSWDSEESCGFDSRPRHSRRTSFAFHPGCGYQLFSAAPRYGLAVEDDSRPRHHVMSEPRVATPAPAEFSISVTRRSPSDSGLRITPRASVEDIRLPALHGHHRRRRSGTRTSRHLACYPAETRDRRLWVARCAESCRRASPSIHAVAPAIRLGALFLVAGDCVWHVMRESPRPPRENPRLRCVRRRAACVSSPES